jgi:glycosyltransferase involved in cell wall biosynthesis
MYSGGQGVYLSNLARELSGLGHEVHVIGGPPYPELPDAVSLHRVQNYNFHRLLATGRRFFYGRPPLDAFHPLNIAELVTTRLGMYSVMGAFSIRAYDRLRALGERFDVVHDNQVLGYGSLLIRNLGLPVVATVHHPLDADRANRIREARSPAGAVRAALFYPFFMQRAVIHRVDRVVAVSSASARSTAQAFRLDPNAIDVVPNGIDGSALRRLPGVRPEPGRLLFVGDAEDNNKGFEYLLRALASLGEAPYHLVAVQRAWSTRPLEMAREFGIADRVTFVDSLSRDELVREYNRAQLLVSPSLYEGFGLPAAEALACGTPVVATTAGAFREIVDDHETGRIAAPRDEAALASAIGELLANPGRCRSMGELGSGRVRERFDWRRTAQRMAAIYEQVARRGPHAHLRLLELAG